MVPVLQVLPVLPVLQVLQVLPVLPGLPMQGEDGCLQSSQLRTGRVKEWLEEEEHAGLGLPSLSEGGPSVLAGYRS